MIQHCNDDLRFRKTACEMKKRAEGRTEVKFRVGKRVSTMFKVGQKMEIYKINVIDLTS